VIAAFAAIALWAEITKKKFALILTEITLGLCIVSMYFGQKTGSTGGEIRHEEIRPSFVVPNAENHE
jgi:hypothetical protein